VCLVRPSPLAVSFLFFDFPVTARVNLEVWGFGGGDGGGAYGVEKSAIPFRLLKKKKKKKRLDRIQKKKKMKKNEKKLKEKGKNE
jgi:hypothetical protein